MSQRFYMWAVLSGQNVSEGWSWSWADQDKTVIKLEAHDEGPKEINVFKIQRFTTSA